LPGTVERAFQFAAECSTMDELHARLIREGHTNYDECPIAVLRRPELACGETARSNTFGRQRIVCFEVREDLSRPVGL
jgi:hypothetical protein